MWSFSARSGDTELMDTESVDLEEFRACLKDLALVNTLTLTHRPVLAWLKEATRDLETGRPSIAGRCGLRLWRSVTRHLSLVLGKGFSLT